LPPNDQLQAEVLVKEGLVTANVRKLGLVTSVGHDGRIFAKNMKRALARHGLSLSFHLPVIAEVDKMGTVAAQIRRFDSDGLILHLPPPVTLKLLADLTTVGVDCAVCLPWIPGLEPNRLGSDYRGLIINLEPFQPSAEDSQYREFSLSYRNRFGTQPPAAAVYAYDAAQLIIRAVHRRGLTRIGIREELANLSGYRGLSGPIEWDNGGGNRMAPVLRMWVP
jgi:ABC-type branched-subunit amino acid transport system substrate-binding protein